ncbi:TonB-dependent receptor [Parapedobacter koreensis]|uniref:TonB-linked outer membrane protein, SusC/RagA family n=1 Tax=Parapedobacter koreensis TaxID=332977 RepID=A0A1H7UK88_9SPHI|nr:TonB-dependent receptor [Parapedobacter koreensis]SEL96707.1 TonB-linked outer membrane protein, SusC/RagA family [Parapedobacter koreensis]
MKNYLLLRWGMLLPNVINRLFLVMRFTAIFLLLGTMHLSGKTLSQTITLNVQNTGLKQVFARVEQQTGYAVLYSDEVVSGIKPVSVNVTEMPLEVFLRKVLSPVFLTYRIDGTSIFIKPSNKLPSSSQKLKLVVPSLQQRSITGSVTGGQEVPLEGASVNIKGSQVGTTTNREGRFTLNVPNANVTLVISYIGYLSQEVSLNGRTTVEVVLQPDDTELEEIVVVGYGTVRRKDLTGSVGSVGADAIRDLAVSRVDQALLGKVPGVQVSPVTGEPGGAPQIRIRGIGSISAAGGPLYVVDGFPIDNIQALNPNDIETIDILKDASATAIYGSRGSNGVVIINTKRGKTGKPVISFDTYFGYQQVSKLPEFMNARQQAEYYFDGVRNENIDNGYDVSGPVDTWQLKVPQTILDVLEGRNANDVSALDAVLRTAPQQQYQLAVTGGTESIKYAISGEYMNQEGIILNSNFDRYSLRANFDTKLSERLSLKMNLNASMTDENRITASGGGGGSNEGVIAQATSAQPYYPLYNPDGTYFEYNNIDASTVLFNPVAVANEIQSKRQLTRFLGNLVAEYEIVEGLRLNVLLGATSGNTKGMYFRPRLPALLNNPALGRDEARTQLNWLTETTLNYDKSFGQHNLSLLGGYTTQKEVFRMNSLSSNNYPNNLVPSLSAVSGIITEGTSELGEWSILSYLARVNYNFASKYYITASVRTDGSSRFGANRKYGVFPSTALAWRISEEAFLNDAAFLNELKLRVSYGRTGNNNIGNYEHYATIDYEKYNLGNGEPIAGFGQARLANPNLTWEKQQSFNVGMDVSVFNNRLNLTVDHFISTNTDLLLSVNIPGITGFNTALQNIGEVRNRGWEFVLGTVNVDKAFRWSTDFNISNYRNEVLKLGPTGDPIFSSRHITMIGQPIGMFYGFLVDGIYQSQAEVDAGPIYNPGAPDRSRPGDIRFVDISGPDGVPDGIIDNSDRTIMGSPYPDFYYGMTNNFSYKNFGLTVNLQGSKGNQLHSEANVIRLLTRSRSRTLISQLDYWKSESEPGDGVTPRPNNAPTGGIRLSNARYLDSGTYLRINNITLNYTFPERLISGLKINSLRVYLSATNPFIFTKNTSFNPDVSNSTNALTPGIDQNNYPLPKSYMIGLNAAF